MAPGVKGAYAKPGGQSSIPRLHRVEGGSPKLPSHCHRHRSLYTHRHTNRKGAWEVPQWPKVLANDRQTNVVGLGVWVFQAEQKKEKAGWWHTPVTLARRRWGQETADKQKGEKMCSSGGEPAGLRGQGAPVPAQLGCVYLHS